MIKEIPTLTDDDITNVFHRTNLNCKSVNDYRYLLGRGLIKTLSGHHNDFILSQCIQELGLARNLIRSPDRPIVTKKGKQFLFEFFCNND